MNKEAIIKKWKNNIAHEIRDDWVKDINSLPGIEDKHCSDHVPMICAFLNCDCEDCQKGKAEIAKRLFEEFMSEEETYAGMILAVRFTDWLDSREE